MSPPVTEPQLRALVRGAREAGANAVGVAAEPRWEGPPTFDEGGLVRVYPCVSTLAVWDALATEPGDNALLVLLTDREDVGEEVLARLWRRQLVRPNRWDSLLSLFRARDLDSSLRGLEWLVDLLIDVAPARGYPPPASGLVDARTAWIAFLTTGFGLSVGEPTLDDLLAWSGSAAAVGPATRVAEGARLAEHLTTEVGAGAGQVFTLTAAGSGGDAVPLGLAIAALWSATSTATVVAARTRLEPLLGGRPLDDRAAHAWGAAAERLVRRSAAEGDEATAARWTARGEQLLLEVQGSAARIESDVLAGAFEDRLEAAGHQLLAALAGRPGDHAVARVQDAVERVASHLASERRPDRVRRLRMAQRLLRRRAQPSSTGTGAADLAAAAAAYLSDGSWVDAARIELHDGDAVSPLGEAYHALVTMVGDERAEVDQRFAEQLAAWTVVLPATDQLLPIERVLEVVVAPVARHVPALLLVLDGLSWAEAHRLLGDVRRLGFVEVAPDHGWPAVVAAVPTVTAVSRTSLLCGRLAVGGQKEERAGFAANTALLEAAGTAALLFHKGDLGVHDGHLAPTVREAMPTPRRASSAWSSTASTTTSPKAASCGWWTDWTASSRCSGYSTRPPPPGAASSSSPTTATSASSARRCFPDPAAASAGGPPIPRQAPKRWR